MKQKDYDFNPHARAWTGGVGKPTKVRRNDGREAPVLLGQLTRVIKRGCSGLVKPSHIFDKLEPYATTKPVGRVIVRAPQGFTKEERKRWHALRKMGLV